MDAFLPITHRNCPWNRKMRRNLKNKNLKYDSSHLESSANLIRDPSSSNPRLSDTISSFPANLPTQSLRGQELGL